MEQTANRIEMHYQDIMKKAEELSSLADRIGYLSDNELASVSNIVNRGWNGNSAKLYQKKIKKLYDDMSAETKRIRKLARQLEKSAKLTYEVEKRGMALFGRKDR